MGRALRIPPSWPSRRSLLKAVFWTCAAPVAAAFVSLVNRHATTASAPRVVEIPGGGSDDIVIVDDVIVCRGGEGGGRDLVVLSARCTHLGCRITGVSDGLLVCPCHGSRFRSDGSVASGPAARPLDRLQYESDRKTGALVVHVG